MQIYHEQEKRYQQKYGRGTLYICAYSVVKTYYKRIVAGLIIQHCHKRMAASEDSRKEATNEQPGNIA